MRKIIDLEDGGKIVRNRVLKVLKETPDYLKLLVDDGSGPRVIKITPECTGHKIRRVLKNLEGTIPCAFIIGGGILLIAMGMKLTKEVWRRD